MSSVHVAVKWPESQIDNQATGRTEVAIELDPGGGARGWGIEGASAAAWRVR